ncbi:hypothetical protein K0M31_015635 [Melipona bicolor]|uniref:Uncharacterized protein n=1 Tax=Melipona bicolor TaxID=60889 RepID=A0AA40FES8_9HYME|nr:hypothetical protein K0M31_015635 [Melipona bicolor]
MVRTFMHNEDDKEASVDIPLGSRLVSFPPVEIPLGKSTLTQGDGVNLENRPTWSRFMTVKYYEKLLAKKKQEKGMCFG